MVNKPKSSSTSKANVMKTKNDLAFDSFMDEFTDDFMVAMVMMIPMIMMMQMMINNMNLSSQ